MKAKRISNDKNLPVPYSFEKEDHSPNDKAYKHYPARYPLAPRTLVDRQEFLRSKNRLKPKRSTIRVQRSYASFTGGMIAYITLLVSGFYISSKFSFLLLTSDLSALGLDLVFVVPLALLPSIVALGYLMAIVHGSYLEIRPNHIKLVTGVLSNHRKQVEVPFDSIFFVEVDQGMLDRLLNFGTLSVGRNIDSGAEIKMSGVSSPHQISEILKARIASAHGEGSYANNLN